MFLGSSGGTLLAQALVLQFEAVGAVDEAVEDGVGQCGVAHGLVPAFDRHLAGDDQGAAIVAVVDDLQQVAPLLGGQRFGPKDPYRAFIDALQSIC